MPELDNYVDCLLVTWCVYGERAERPRRAVSVSHHHHHHYHHRLSHHSVLADTDNSFINLLSVVSVASVAASCLAHGLLSVCVSA